MGLWTEVILWEGDKPKFKTHFHKITSMDLYHNIFLLHKPSIPTSCLNHKNKSHPVKSAQARTLGVSVMISSTRGEAILPQKQNCPSSLWKSREKPFSQERFLGLLSFGIFPLQKQRKVHNKQSSSETFILTPLCRKELPQKNQTPSFFVSHCFSYKSVLY